MSEQAHHQPSVKLYYYVFAALLILTVVTVLVSFVHIGIVFGVAVALLIAVIKSSLVASFFMHLIAEKKFIYYTLLMAGAFLISMMILFVVSYYDLPQGAEYIKPAVSEKTAVQHEAAGEHHVP